MEEQETPKSEFGKGLTYCLGLFLAHAERDREYREIEEKLDKKEHSYWGYPSMWFDGAADHLFEMIIPEDLSSKLKNRLHSFQKKCLAWRISTANSAPTWDDVSWAIVEAGELLREVDNHMGVETLEAKWK